MVSLMLWLKTEIFYKAQSVPLSLPPLPSTSQGSRNFMRHVKNMFILANLQVKKIWEEHPSYPSRTFCHHELCLHRLWVYSSMWPCFPEVTLSCFKNPSFLWRKHVLWLAGSCSAACPLWALDSSPVNGRLTVPACSWQTKALTTVVCMPVFWALSRLRSQAGEFPRVRMASLGDGENLSPETKTRKKKCLLNTNHDEFSCSFGNCSQG